MKHPDSNKTIRVRDRHLSRGYVDLESERLIIRPFAMDDLQDVHRILDVELAEVNGPRRNQSD
jgi:hypothetical protein